MLAIVAPWKRNGPCCALAGEAGGVISIAHATEIPMRYRTAGTPRCRKYGQRCCETKKSLESVSADGVNAASKNSISAHRTGSPVVRLYQLPWHPEGGVTVGNVGCGTDN